MTTLQEIAMTVVQIREAMEDLTLKGSQNAAILLFCNKKCNEIVTALNEACKTAPPGDIEVQLEMTDGTNDKEDSNGNHCGITDIN